MFERVSRAQWQMFERVPGTRWLLIAGLAVAIVWYPALTWLLGFSPGAKVDFGLAFNSMAEHLLSGRFDVDPDAIGAEGFDVGGRTVSYFGIFCALLRIPLVLLPGGTNIDVTWWSCLMAAWLSTWFQIRSIGLVWSGPLPNRQAWLAAGLLISVILGGQHIQFLRPSIYQETINWAFFQSAAFIFLAMRGLNTSRGFDRSTLCWMAVCAGLALLTRVTFGIGLYAASGCLLLARGRPRDLLAPCCILLAFAAMAGVVNEGRWGNPFTIAECGSAGVAVAQHGRWMRGEIPAPGGATPPSAEAIRVALGGRDLACWCALAGPCHADLLLTIANKV